MVVSDFLECLLNVKKTVLPQAENCVWFCIWSFSPSDISFRYSDSKKTWFCYFFVIIIKKLCIFAISNNMIESRYVFMFQFEMSSMA